MDIRTIPRTALDGYLRLARKPVDAATGLLPGDGANARLVVDRAEAVVRDMAGRLWRDPELQEDARRRRLAADERERAMRLRDAAEVRAEQADAERRRREQAAAEQRDRAWEQAAAEKRRAAEQAGRQKAAVRKAAAEAEAKVEKQARAARLEQLDDEARALAEQEKALVAADEAQRLRKAAARTKATRKQAG
jgi:colicin import membrane protein